MKNIFTFMILLITQISWSQTDSIINTKSMDCLITKSYMKKNPVFKNNEFTTDSVEIKRVKNIIFMSNDSLYLIKGIDKIYGLNSKDLKEVSIKSGTHWFAGLILGCLAGGLISGGAVSGMNDFGQGTFKAIGIASGTVICGIIGALIGSGIDGYESLDLRNTLSDAKKTKLLEFIRQNK